ncbi:MAG: hypothetical protein WAS21_28965 [Geminicoccaceae bacterium]
MRHQRPAASTDPNDQGEAAELRRGLVFFWWLVLLLLPIGREASGSTPPMLLLPLPLHAAFVLGSTALLLLVRMQASAAAVPLTTIAPLLIGLGLGLELVAALLTLCLRASFDIVTDVPFYPATFLAVHADTLAYGVGALAFGLVTRLGHAAWAAAHAGQPSEAMLALLLAYASTRLLLSLCLGLPTESALAAWNVAAALPLGMLAVCLGNRFRPQPESLPQAPGS